MKKTGDNPSRRIIKRRIVTRESVFALFLCLACIGLGFMPTGYEKDSGDEETYHVRGKIIEVDNSEIQQFGVLKAGHQSMTVRIMSGSHKGKEVEAVNNLLGKMDLDEIYQEGDAVLLEYQALNGEPETVVLRGRYRLRMELLLLIIFSVLLISVGGWVGAKALLSFIFAVLMIWKVMLPLFLKGYNPVLIALAVVAVLTGAICLLVGGLTRKGLVAFLGAIAGLMLTAVLARLFWGGFRIHGAVRPFSETLLYSGYAHLNLTRIFLAGVFIAASGAVMDLSMDISAAMDEVSHKVPGLGLWELTGSGLRVGRAVIGTMTTTLLLAYSASYINMLMLLMAQGIPLQNMFNHNYIAAEILHTLVGSFGLVTVAPLTALVGGIIYSLPHRNTSAEKHIQVLNNKS